jgi:hypothetical protein
VWRGMGDAEDADVVEEESAAGDEAAGRRGGAGGGVLEVELEAGRKVRQEDLGGDLVLGHDELAPVGGEKGAGHCG